MEHHRSEFSIYLFFFPPWELTLCCNFRVADTFMFAEMPREWPSMWKRSCCKSSKTLASKAKKKLPHTCEDWRRANATSETSGLRSQHKQRQDRTICLLTTTHGFIFFLSTNKKNSSWENAHEASSESGLEVKGLQTALTTRRSPRVPHKLNFACLDPRIATLSFGPKRSRIYGKLHALLQRCIPRVYGLPT